MKVRNKISGDAFTISSKSTHYKEHILPKLGTEYEDISTQRTPAQDWQAYNFRRLGTIARTIANLRELEKDMISIASAVQVDQTIQVLQKESEEIRKAKNPYTK